MNEPIYDKTIFRNALTAFLRGEKLQHEEAIKAVERWMDSGKESLLLMGRVGTGKTTIASALRCAWAHYLSVSRIYKCDWIALQVEADKSWVQEVGNNSGLLILDDLGTEKKVYGEEVIPAIIYMRDARRQPTAITTNLNFDQIRARYGERIADRLRTWSKVVMDYGSLRKTAQ